MEPSQDEKNSGFFSLPKFLKRVRSVRETTIDIPHDQLQLLEPKTYPQAWIALFLLVLLRTAVSVFQFTFSIIPDVTGEYYHASLTAVNWFANIQCIIYVIMSFFTGFIFEYFGVKISLLFAGFLLAVGSTIRTISAMISPPSYIFTMVGQVVGGCASPMALNIMTMFASTWFTENLRATAGMFVASNYGAILVMFVIPSITSSAYDIPRVLTYVAYFCILVFGTLLLMPAKPPTPPSRIQDEQRPPFFQGLKLLLKNYSFWIIFMIHSLNVGLSIAFCALFAQIIGPHGYTNSDAGQLNAIAFIAGTLGCTVAGPVLDKTKQFKLFLKLVAPMVLITDVGMIFMIQKGAFSSVLFVTSLNQFFLSFLVPVAIEIGSETSYPVSEATTSSLLWQGAQIFGFVFVMIMDATRSTGANAVPQNNMTNALIFQAIVACLIMFLSLLFNGKMRRTEANLIGNQPLLNDREITSVGYPVPIGISLLDPPTSTESITVEEH